MTEFEKYRYLVYNNEEVVLHFYYQNKTLNAIVEGGIRPYSSS